MKNSLKKRILAIIICAILTVSVVSVVGAANAAVPTASVAAGEGNYLINGGFEADLELSSDSGSITTGWVLNNTKNITPALSDEAHGGEQALKIDLSGTDSDFTLLPSIADENGKITNLKMGVYYLSMYVKGSGSLTVNYYDANYNQCRETYNQGCNDNDEWKYIKIPMGLGTTGRLQFTIDVTENTAKAGQSIYIDDVSLCIMPSVINGEFEESLQLPETSNSLVADGNFEVGTVNSFKSASGGTVNLFEAENGYGLRAYAFSGMFAELNTNAQNAHSGSRSLKLYTDVSRVKQYVSISPLGATAKHATKDVYFFDNLESGSYAVKFYAKVPLNLDSDTTNDTRLLLRAFDWNTGDAIATLDKGDVTADSNGWYCYEMDVDVDESGYLGVSLYITTGQENPSTLREIYIDDFSITRKPPKEAGLITNGDFESGSVNALKSSVSKMNVFNAGSGYGLNAHTYTGMITELNTDSQYAYSGNRSLKIATDKNKAQQYIAIAPEAATEKHATKDVYFCKNVASGTYTVKFYAKIVGSNTNLTLYSFDWSTGNKLAEIKKSGLTPDANGWYCYETDVTVKADGYLGVKIYITAGSNVEEAVYIDDISILEKTETETETETALITNGDFEEGTVSTAVFSKIEKSGKNKIFTAADGSELATGYHFTTANYSNNNGKFAISTTEHFSGSRSLKFYSNTTTATSATIIPEIATVHKNNHHYISGLESGKYIFTFSFKEDAGSSQVYLKSYNYSDGTETLKLRVDNKETEYPADSNGWKTVSYEFTVGSDGYLNIEIYIGDVTDTTAVYLDAISLTKKVENNLITNGSFEEGTVSTAVFNKIDKSGKNKIFTAADGSELATGYHFTTANYSNNNGKFAISTTEHFSGSRSLKFYSNTTTATAATIIPEIASVHKSNHHYISGLAAGNYTLKFSFKEDAGSSQVYLKSYNYSDGSEVLKLRVDNKATEYPADSNGWKTVEKEFTVGSDGYLNIEIYVGDVTDTVAVYLDDISLIGDAPQSVTPPAPTVPAEKDTDIPYWATTAEDAGKSVLSIVKDDVVSGDSALKITQNADKSIELSPKFNKNSIATGYNMFAFHAKGDGSIKIKLETTSATVEKDITLENSWNMYRIRDIEIKASETIKKITLTVKGIALIDAVQLYAQAGPALLTENLSLSAGTRALCMPAVADGYKVEVKASSNTDIIDLEGKITKPDYDTAVEVVLGVTNINDATDTANSHVFTVNVAGKNGEEPSADYKQTTLTDSQTGISVSAVMNPDSKFRAMAIASDNRYYEEMLLEDMQDIAFYNTVLTPKGEHSSKLQFKFPLDSKYNGKTITVVYKADGVDPITLESKIQDGFIVVETDADGFFMLQIEKPAEKNETPAGTVTKPEEQPKDDNKKPEEPSKDSAKEPSKETSKEPTLEVEKTDKNVIMEKLIDNTLIWIIVIIAAAAILIIVEITVTTVVKKKIKRS